MAHFIEEARSGRAVCRTCKEAIARGELRLGEEIPSAFSGKPGIHWHHLPCAADARPAQLLEAMSAYRGELPERELLQRRIELALGNLPPTEFPYAERAPSSRAHCLHCGATIEQGTLRVAIEHAAMHATYVRLAAGYLHAWCARPYGLGDQDEALIRTHSRGLSPLDLGLLERALHGDRPGEQFTLF